MISKQFLAWLRDKQANTNDKAFRMGINFVLFIDLYREFRALNPGNTD